MKVLYTAADTGKRSEMLIITERTVHANDFLETSLQQLVPNHELRITGPLLFRLW